MHGTMTQSNMPRRWCNVSVMAVAVCLTFVLPTPATAAPPPPADCPSPPHQAQYEVFVVDRPNHPLISAGNGSNHSAFRFSFAATWFNTPQQGQGLVVRVVECNPDHQPDCGQSRNPQWVNAGALAVTRVKLDDAQPTAEFLGYDNVTWLSAQPPKGSEQWGFIDPRLSYHPATGTHFLAFDNCSHVNCGGRQTLLASSRDPFDPTAWTLHGPAFPWLKYTAGASMLFREQGLKHLAFIGNSNTADAILLAESDDGLTWKEPEKVSDRTFMEKRPGCWDHVGIAPGGQPMRLSNGNFLFIFNVDTGFPFNPKRNPYRCAVGWAIVNATGEQPVIVARATEPLLVPTMPWETCPDGESTRCQQPMVVFSTGLAPVAGIDDAFHVIFGGADTAVGIATVQVNLKQGK
eukprot:m.349980 g.349980  ORF g.349980 m.349980 type:complete len:405 (+) comp19885_c0_seq3:512-1726(+)